jgi:hypothetical protein
MKKYGKIIFVIVLIIVIGLVVYFSKENKEDIKDKQQSSAGEVYAINHKEFYLNENNQEDENSGMKLLEYDNTPGSYAEIYYIFYDYDVDPSYYYTLEITDNSGNSLLLNNEVETLFGGIVTSVRIQKISLDKTINFSISERDYETENISKSAKLQVNLADALETKIEIDQSENLKNGKLGDISFNYVDDEYVYFGTTAHTYSENLVGENCSLPIKGQYGNALMLEDYIEFSYDKNVNNLTLDEAFEALALITKTVGQYGLSDVYGMDITDENDEIIDTVIIDYNDMIKLCNGETIVKNKKEYTKDSFATYAELTMVKDTEVELANGITAIKYHYEEGNIEDYYMFVYNGNIYQISLPVDARISTEIQQFLSSLKIDG